MTTTARITLQALMAMQTELNTLLTVKRPQATAQLKDARELGDLSENAEFQIAQQSLQSINNRISEIQHYISNAEIIEITGAHTYVTIGATVTLKTNGRKEVVKFVDQAEMDPLNSTYSTNCALYKALQNKTVGFAMEFITPAYTDFIEILAIQ